MSDIQICAIPPPEMVANLRAKKSTLPAPDPVNRRAVIFAESDPSVTKPDAETNLLFGRALFQLVPFQGTGALLWGAYQPGLRLAMSARISAISLKRPSGASRVRSARNRASKAWPRSPSAAGDVLDLE